MAVQPIVFYALAAAVVAASLGSVRLVDVSRSGISLAAALLAAALLELLTGSRLLAVLQLLIGALIGTLLMTNLRRGDQGWLLAARGRLQTWWPLAAALAAAYTAVLVWILVVSSAEWQTGHGPTALLSLIQQREPLAAAVAAVLLIVSAVGGRLLLRPGVDEEAVDRRRADRRERDERMRRRREDRLAARRRPGSPTGEAAP